MTRILVASVGGDEKDVSTKLDVVRVALTSYWQKKEVGHEGTN